MVAGCPKENNSNYLCLAIEGEHLDLRRFCVNCQVAEATQYWMSENTSKVLNVTGQGRSVSVCYCMFMLSLSFQMVYKLLENPFGYLLLWRRVLMIMK